MVATGVGTAIGSFNHNLSHRRAACIALYAKLPGTRSPRTTCLCQARLASLMLTEQVVYPSLHGSCASLCMKLCVKLCDRCRVGRRPGRLSVKLACSDVAWPDVEPEPPEPPAGQGSKLSSSGSAWGPPDETSSTEEAKSEGCRAGLDMALPFAFLHELFGRRSKLSEDCLSLAPLFATQVVEAHLAKSCGKMCMEVALRHVRSWRSKTSFLSAACSAEVLALYMAHVRICHALQRQQPVCTSTDHQLLHVSCGLATSKRTGAHMESASQAPKKLLPSRRWTPNWNSRPSLTGR